MGIAPGHNLANRVRAGNEEQVSIRAQGAQLVKRIKGVGCAATVNINTAHRKTRVRRGRNHRHQVAMLSVAHVPLPHLLPGLTGRNEHDLVQVEHGGNFTSCHQVSVVNRVEGSTHHAQTHPTGSARGNRLGARSTKIKVNRLVSHKCRPCWGQRPHHGS